MYTPDTLLEFIPAVSKKIIPALKRLGLRTVRDLLYHFPTRHEDFPPPQPIRDIREGENATAEGVIQKIASRRTAKKHMALVEITISDQTGSMKALWFNQPFLARNFKEGQRVRLSGKITMGPAGLCMQNPAYEKLPSSKFPQPRQAKRGGQVPSSGIHTGRLVPIYPETYGITSRWIRHLIALFLDARADLSDPLPSETRKRHNLAALGDALLAIHFPKTDNEAEQARRRFAFERLLLVQLRALRNRSRLKQHRAPAIPLNIALLKEFVASLPYDLTTAQRRSIWEIVRDISRSKPMNRLLEGDVGSGKTVVAAAAALLAAKAGLRSVFMAPTEILARQHFQTLKKILIPFRLEIGLLTGSVKRTEGSPEIIVGTHALIQKNARFGNLGLAVIDEQHRFGVDQRALLANPKAQSRERDASQLAAGPIPHFLSMSATPMPRTLVLALWGDLDVSMLDEMPAERKPVATKIAEPGKRDETYQFIRDEVRRGRQVFVVCPRIEAESLTASQQPTANSQQQKLLNAEIKSVKQEYQKLSENIFPDLRIAMLHGKMKPKEKEAVMEKFKSGKLDILISTSVIEVGVDVPNATVMMIEGAERFGLAQLHQFRGRVGRGAEQSYCLLFPTEDGMVTQRLRALTESNNGFELAEKDLQIRGPGEVFGTRQWGESDIPIGTLGNAPLIRAVRAEAMDLVKKSPDLGRFPELRAALEQFEKAVHLE